MAKKFNIDILLNLITEGKDEFSDIERLVKSLAKSTKRSETEVKGTLNSLITNSSKASGKLGELLKVLEKVKYSTDGLGSNQINPVDDGEVNRAIKLLRDLISEITKYKKELHSLGEDDAARGILELRTAFQQVLGELKKGKKEIADFNKNEIAPKLAEDFEFTIKRAQEEFSKLTKTYQDFNKISKSSGRDELINVKSLRDAEGIIETLRNELSILLNRANSSQIKDLIDPNIEKRLLSAIGKVNNLGTDFTELSQRIDDINEKEILPSLTTKLNSGISAAKSEINSLEKEIKKAQEAGTSFASQKDFLNALEELRKKVGSLRDISNNIGDSSNKVSTLEDSLVSLEKALDISDADLRKNDETVRQFKLHLDNLKDSYKNLEREVNNTSKALDKSATDGTLLTDAPQYRQKLADLRQELVRLRVEYEKNKLEITGIDQAIQKIDTLAKTANQSDDALRQLDEQVRKIKLDKAFENEKAKQELKELEIELAQLIKEIKRLKEEGKNIEIVTTLKKKAETVQGKIQNFEDTTTDNTLLPRVARAKVGITGVTGVVKEIEDALPKSALGRSFVELGERIRGVGKAAGGQQAVIKSFATGLRLIGTSAFLVGGELRGVGFAFTALGSIMQNFAPIALRVLQALGPFAPALIVLSANLIAAGVQIAGFAAAMGLIIAEGIKFNSALELATNNIAGLVTEYFKLDFSLAKNSVGEAMGKNSQAFQEFAAAQQIASEALQKLEVDALATNFTFQELLQPFQSVITTLGTANTSLDDARELAVGFARVGTLVGYNSEQVSTSISEILAGVGRSTNRIQRQLNTLTDSAGIKLTRERIRELRAQNPAKLIDEMTSAFARLTAQAAEANTKTLPGVISNFKDFFGAFSRRTVFPGLEILKKTLNDIYARLVPIKDILAGKTKVPFTEEVQKLLKFVTEIATILLNDFSKALRYIFDYVLSLANYFEQNKESVVGLYNAIKVTAKVVALLVYDFLAIFGIVGDTKNEFGLIKSILGIIVVSVNTIRLFFIGIRSTLDAVGLALNFVFLIIYKISEAIFDLFPKTVRDYVMPGLKENIKEKEKQIQRFLGNLEDSNKEIGQIFQDGSDFFNSKGLTDEEKKKAFENINIFGKEDPDKVKKIGKIITKSIVAYYDELIALAKNRNDILVSETEKRIDTELKIINLQRDLGIRSQEDFNNRSAELEKERIAVQLRSLEEEKNILNERLNLKNPASINRAYEREIAEIRAKFEQEGEKEGEDRSAELENRIAEANNRRNKEILKTQQELEQVDSRLKILKASIPQVDLDLAKNQLDNIINTRKEIFTLREEIAQAENQPFKQQDSTFIAKATEEISLQYRKTAADAKYFEEKVRELQQTLKIQYKGSNPAIQEQIGLYQEQARNLRAINNIVLEKIAIEQRARQVERVNQNIEVLQSGLAREENEINRQVTFGIISQQDAVVKLASARRQYKKVLLEQIAELRKAQEQETASSEQISQLRDLEQQLKSIDDTVSESVLLNINQQVGDGLVDFFEKIQESIGNTKSALQDLGQTFLKAFRKTIAQQIVQQFFAPIIGQLGQTEGKAQGFLAGFLRNLGIEPAVKQNQQAQIDTAQNPIGGLDLVKTQGIQTIGALVEEVKKGIDARIKEEDKFLLNFNIQVGNVTESLKDLGDIVIGLKQATKDALNFIVSKGGQLPDDSLQKSIKVLPDAKQFKFKSQLDGSGVNTGNIVDRVIQGKGVIFNPTAAESLNSGSTNVALQQTTSTISTAFRNILSNFDILSIIQKNNTGELSNNTNVLAVANDAIKTLTENIGVLITSFESLTGQTISNVATSGGEGGGSRITRIFDTITGVIDAFKKNGKAAGGYISGKGGRIQDMVPAMLSNGEFVISAATVQKYGKSFFDNINRGFAAGGFVLPDASKYNYTGGGASLINKPAPISIDFAALQASQQPKKKSLFKRIFGGALSFVAPFLNLIPGIGPFLSIGAGALGGALSGTDRKSSILGGILGGLGNFGGFAGKGGKLGGIAGFLKKSKVQDILGVFGGALNNGASTLGFFGNSIFEKYFKPKKSAYGGMIRRKPKKYLFGGFVSGLSGLFSKLSGISKGSGGTGIFSGATARAGTSGGGFLSKLFSGDSKGLGALLGLFGGFFGGSGNQTKANDFDTVNPAGFEGSADPDYLRKNLYGSAYNYLTDSGSIAKFNYTQEILDFIDSVYSGVGNSANSVKSGNGILGNLLGFATTIASVFGLFKKSGAPANSFNSSAFKNLKNQFLGGNFTLKAAGGFVQGRGSATSDSIPAMLSNGEYVIRASAVKNLGVNLLDYLNNARNIDTRTLDYINSGRVKLAAGGLVGEGIDSIGNNSNSSAGVNVDARTKIINVLDPNLLQEFMNTSDGRRTLVNLISANKSMFRSALGV